MIGFFDSGVGGLTIAQPFYQKTHLECLFFGDSTHCPLGEKTDNEIHEIVKSGVEKLLLAGCNLVILACNTATAISIRDLQQHYLPLQSFSEPKNILGIIQPTNEAILASCVLSDSVSILATPATIHSGFYQRELEKLGFKNIHGVSAAELAKTIESDDKKLARQIVREIFSDNHTMIRGSKALVLACTHYPIIQNIIQDELINIDSKALIISQSNVVVYELISYLQRHPEYQQTKGSFRVI